MPRPLRTPTGRGSMPNPWAMPRASAPVDLHRVPGLVSPPPPPLLRHRSSACSRRDDRPAPAPNVHCGSHERVPLCAFAGANTTFESGIATFAALKLHRPRVGSYTVRLAYDFGHTEALVIQVVEGARLCPRRAHRSRRQHVFDAPGPFLKRVARRRPHRGLAIPSRSPPMEWSDSGPSQNGRRSTANTRRLTVDGCCLRR